MPEEREPLLPAMKGRISIMVSKKEKEDWEEAARGDKRSLSSWIRQAGNKALRESHYY